MRQLLQACPKAELHVHLEGSLRPSTIARLTGGGPNAQQAAFAQAEAVYQYRNFADFITAFKWAVGFLETPEAYALAAQALFAELAQQGVTYAEVTLAAGVVRWKQLPLKEVYAALVESAATAPLEVAWVLDCIRQFGAAQAEPVADFAITHARQRRGNCHGIVAFGIGGDEQGAPAADFATLAAAAKTAGLGFCPHAGENSNADNIWQMLELGADRIGHGIRAVQDPVLVAHLQRQQIPLEICLSSNVRLGAVPNYAEHPLRLLYEAGVPIILNSDDPAMFQTTLVDEYCLAAQHQRFTQDELVALAASSFRFALRH